MQSVLGKSPLAYFQSLRVERAVRLLKISSASVDEVAAPKAQRCEFFCGGASSLASRRSGALPDSIDFRPAYPARRIVMTLTLNPPWGLPSVPQITFCSARIALPPECGHWVA